MRGFCHIRRARVTRGLPKVLGPAFAELVKPPGYS
jgi:hypothetical protein